MSISRTFTVKVLDNEGPTGSQVTVFTHSEVTVDEEAAPIGARLTQTAKAIQLIKTGRLLLSPFRSDFSRLC